MMSRWTGTFWRMGLLGAIIILGWGGFQWWQALAYQPVTPVQAPLNHFTFSIEEPNPDPARYQRLFSGELFFGTVVQPLREFYSSLKLLGLINGANPRAVVAVAGSDGQTWIVKPGTVAGGEQIIAIGADYILVKNESGEGMVPLENGVDAPGPPLLETRAD